ncbi:MAG: serine/threonine protein kinase [Coriobacteriales bacterium]|nr:serine/threonine protein kinase [Coriobacteriales bacterium]
MELQLILGRYRPLELLGSGGFGEVVLAYDTRMQRRVAIKRMPLPTPGLRAEAPGLSEARTAAMLNHSGIVTVYDFDTDADEAFLIMEYVDGASLAEVLDEMGGPLDEDEAAAVFGPVFDAIAFAHENGVVHLDLKPENVLVARDGRVKVADFGVSALSTAAGHSPAEGGTLGFMPVEQLEGGRVTPKTDIWALGALAYESLADANPWSAETVDDAIYRLESEQPPPSNYVRVPAEVDDAIERATATAAADRWPTAREFADALLPFLGDATAGRESLAEVADALASDEGVDIDRAVRGLGLWDRAGQIGLWAVRAVAGVEAAALAFFGISAFWVGPLPAAGAAALVGLAGVLAPPLGIGLGALALALGMITAGAWLPGIVLAIVGIAYWWFFARRSWAASVVPFSAPMLSLAWLGPAAPLIAGFALAPVAAALSGFLSAWSVSIVGALTAEGIGKTVATIVPLAGATPTGGYTARLIGASVADVAVVPSTWLLAVVWALAAAVASWPARNATRVGGIVGIALGGAVLAGGTLLVGLAQGLPHAPSTLWLPLVGPLALSLILMFAVAMLGAPVRPEPDELRAAGLDEG